MKNTEALTDLGIDLTKAVARVTDHRADNFVEFEFTLGDPDLTVELVLPLENFEQFCSRFSAKVIRD